MGQSSSLCRCDPRPPLAMRHLIINRLHKQPEGVTRLVICHGERDPAFRFMSFFGASIELDLYHFFWSMVAKHRAFLTSDFSLIPNREPRNAVLERSSSSQKPKQTNLLGAKASAIEVQGRAHSRPCIVIFSPTKQQTSSRHLIHQRTESVIITEE